MRRLDPRPTGLFRGYELTRLIAATLLLGIIGLYYFQAVNPKTWTGIARDDTAPSDDSVRAAVSPEEAARWKEIIVPIPGSEGEDGGARDPEQIDAFKEEAQVIQDREVLTAEEMASYWRLFRWARAEPSVELENRARRDLFFTHFAQAPATYRGELVRLKLNVARVLPNSDLKQNSADVKQVYEAWGTTSDSQSYPYVVVFPDLPPQLPIGVNLVEQAVFTGFFHKLMLYKTPDGQTHFAPLFLGRIRWTENPVSAHYKRQASASGWIIGGVIGVILIIFGTQWWYSRPMAVTIPERPVDQKALDRFLETGEIPDSPPSGPPEWLLSDEPPPENLK